MVAEVTQRVEQPHACWVGLAIWLQVAGVTSADGTTTASCGERIFEASKRRVCRDSKLLDQVCKIEDDADRALEDGLGGVLLGRFVVVVVVVIGDVDAHAFHLYAVVGRLHGTGSAATSVTETPTEAIDS